MAWTGNRHPPTRNLMTSQSPSDPSNYLLESGVALPVLRSGLTEALEKLCYEMALLAFDRQVQECLCPCL
jgi:hypothetical protein